MVPGYRVSIVSLSGRKGKASHTIRTPTRPTASFLVPRNTAHGLDFGSHGHRCNRLPTKDIPSKSCGSNSGTIALRSLASTQDQGVSSTKNRSNPQFCVPIGVSRCTEPSGRFSGFFISWPSKRLEQFSVHAIQHADVAVQRRNEQRIPVGRAPHARHRVSQNIHCRLPHADVVDSHVAVVTAAGNRVCGCVHMQGGNGVTRFGEGLDWFIGVGPSIP